MPASLNDWRVTQGVGRPSGDTPLLLTTRLLPIEFGRIDPFPRIPILLGSPAEEFLGRASFFFTNSIFTQSLIITPDQLFVAICVVATRAQTPQIGRLRRKTDGSARGRDSPLPQRPRMGLLA